MKKILITGGAGYIGSHTVTALMELGIVPVLIDNFSNSDKLVLSKLKEITGKTIKCFNGDCNNRLLVEEIFKSEKISGVIHFAASKAVGESTRIPLKYYENNINSLITVLQAMEKFKVQDVVFSSSCTVYGQPDHLPVDENTLRKEAESPYGNTKKVCEDILCDFVNSGASIKAVSLRYFNPIGAHPTGLIGELPLGLPNNLVPFVTQTGAGLRDKLTVFGNDYNTIDGTCVRDYIHVMDLANAHAMALEYLYEKKPAFYDVFNVGTGNGSTVLEVIAAFEKVSGRKLNYEIGERRKGDIEKIWANTDKVKKVLKWYPRYSLQDSLEHAWKWQLNITC